ncbi:MAG: tRNA 2-thiouridine(34) synthase MnmA [Clostridiales bacterium]|nr:tRNA 2-thiouridine(34) synthase MnmA [Clostridiales bacterium]
MRKTAERILVGFSGGADSTAAVLLLREQGWDVTGLHFLVDPAEKSASVTAEKIADALEMPLILKDVSKRFDDIVIRNFCLEYRAGRTPNPCILCNPSVKFHVLCEEADRMGIFHIATGHYARIHQDPKGNLFIKKGADSKKDQSYMLYRLTKDVLARTLFPLGGVDSKEEIRRYLEECGAPNARSEDSQDICFIQSGAYQEFLQERGVVSVPGPFKDRNGKILGMHGGIQSYTPGQRKGLGIALGRPAYVVDIDSNKNTVILGAEEELYRNRVELRDAFFTVHGSVDVLPEAYRDLPVEVKLRYTVKGAEAVLRQEGDSPITVLFDRPQRAPAPGQSAVFYVKDLLIGGGCIR